MYKPQDPEYDYVLMRACIFTNANFGFAIHIQPAMVYIGTHNTTQSAIIKPNDNQTN